MYNCILEKLCVLVRVRVEICLLQGLLLAEVTGEVQTRVWQEWVCNGGWLVHGEDIAGDPLQISPAKSPDGSGSAAGLFESLPCHELFMRTNFVSLYVEVVVDNRCHGFLWMFTPIRGCCLSGSKYSLRTSVNADLTMCCTGTRWCPELLLQHHRVWVLELETVSHTQLAVSFQHQYLYTCAWKM